MQQFAVDEELESIDRMLLTAKQLEADFGQLCNWLQLERENWQEERELRLKCLENIIELRACAANSKIDVQEITQTLYNIMNEADLKQISEPVAAMISQLKQNIQKMYLACIHDEGSYHKVKLENYYATEHTKNALIVYIVYPFLFPDSVPGHTNQVEAKKMAELLCELGYNVDLVNTRYDGTIDAEKYDLVIGTGTAFEQICREAREDTVTIYYLTESSPYFSNIAELQRLRAFEERNLVKMPFERQALHTMNLQTMANATAAICIGNERTMSTYHGMFEQIYSISASGFTGAFATAGIEKAANVEKNFLWYGGAGPIHKGLDICIEAFRELPGLNLYIVGDVHHSFYEFYRDDIENGQNIFYYGFLNKDSDEFQDVCGQCGFCLSPSCSEGQSTSVITTMFAGMISVCTPETGIDMEACGGIEIKSLDIKDIRTMLKTLANLPEAEVRTRREKVHQYVWENHTPEKYKAALEQILREILECSDKQ